MSLERRHEGSENLAFNKSTEGKGLDKSNPDVPLDHSESVTNESPEASVKPQAPDNE